MKKSSFFISVQFLSSFLFNCQYIDLEVVSDFFKNTCEIYQHVQIDKKAKYIKHSAGFFQYWMQFEELKKISIHYDKFEYKVSIKPYILTLNNFEKLKRTLDAANIA